MIDPLVALIAGVIACVANNLPWQRIFGLSKDAKAESANFPPFVVGFASFFVCQCGLLVSVLASRRTPYRLRWHGASAMIMIRS